MGCCDGKSWKREEKKDHRFDYLEIKDFHTNSIGCRLGHCYVWISAFRAFAILGLDIYTAIGLLVLHSYKSTVTQQTFIAHDITKWIFAGCIILSVVLLIWDWIFAIRIIRSKNISFAFTNVIANRVYSMRRYDYHCLFYRLSSSSHKSNKVAFWVFFSFQGWKRLLLSEGPRQAINALTVFSVLSTRNFALNAAAYADITPFQWTVLGFMALSLLIWLFSFVRFCIAALIFFPLLCHIRGGLTEFVVRKIDKRIETIIEKARKKRLDRYAEARKHEGLPTVPGSKKYNTPQRTKSIIAEKPTLPSISLGIDDVDEKYSVQSNAYAFGSDTASILSHGSMDKSPSSFNLATYPTQRSDVLPLYTTSQPQDTAYPAYQQTQATLPSFSPDSPPRLENDPSTYRSAPSNSRRPPMQPVPSYHRQESYGRPAYSSRSYSGNDRPSPESLREVSSVRSQSPPSSQVPGSRPEFSMPSERSLTGTNHATRPAQNRLPSSHSNSSLQSSSNSIHSQQRPAGQRRLPSSNSGQSLQSSGSGPYSPRQFDSQHRLPSTHSNDSHPSAPMNQMQRPPRQSPRPFGA